jgi:hypothetical protein
MDGFLKLAFFDFLRLLLELGERLLEFELSLFKRGRGKSQPEFFITY